MRSSFVLAASSFLAAAAAFAIDDVSTITANGDVVPGAVEANVDVFAIVGGGDRVCVAASAPGELDVTIGCASPDGVATVVGPGQLVAGQPFEQVDVMRAATDGTVVVRSFGSFRLDAFGSDNTLHSVLAHGDTVGLAVVDVVGEPAIGVGGVVAASFDDNDGVKRIAVIFDVVDTPAAFTLVEPGPFPDGNDTVGFVLEPPVVLDDGAVVTGACTDINGFDNLTGALEGRCAAFRFPRGAPPVLLAETGQVVGGVGGDVVVGAVTRVLAGEDGSAWMALDGEAFDQTTSALTSVLLRFDATGAAEIMMRSGDALDTSTVVTIGSLLSSDGAFYAQPLLDDGRTLLVRVDDGGTKTVLANLSAPVEGLAGGESLENGAISATPFTDIDGSPRLMLEGFSGGPGFRYGAYSVPTAGGDASTAARAVAVQGESFTDPDGAARDVDFATVGFGATSGDGTAYFAVGDAEAFGVYALGFCNACGAPGVPSEGEDGGEGEGGEGGGEGEGGGGGCNCDAAHNNATAVVLVVAIVVVMRVRRRSA